jgi:hypothetical protein
MKTIKGNAKGFFALANDTARQISHCLNNNENWYINWGTETLYYDKNQGLNVWEYYFKQPHSPTDNTSIVEGYTELVLLKDTFRETMHEIYNKYFVLNDYVNKILKPHIDIFEQHNILGVHIRRTDKFCLGNHGTTFQQSPVDLELFIKEIDTIKDNYDYIFLATDCLDTCNHFNKIYGKKLIFNRNGFRSTGSRSIHADCQNISGYKKGLDVLSDVHLLSKCKYLIRSSSNVSITALYLNLHLNSINLNVKYNGDIEEGIL